MEESQSMPDSVATTKSSNELSANVENETKIPNEPSRNKEKHFIEANSEEVDILHLDNDCVVPVFSKDNELTISHPAFIETVWEAAHSFFQGEAIEQPNIRVSHVIKGRIPSAIHKPASKLEDADKTIYYERMAFCFEIPSIYEEIDGKPLKLSIGGVRAYNNENLFSKKGKEKFKVFIGFKNIVCCNLCVFTDGYLDKLEAANTGDLFVSALELFLRYNPEKHLKQMKSLEDTYISESQFAQILGKMQLYNYLPLKEQKEAPRMLLTDAQINAVAKAYYKDENFGGSYNGLSMWNFYNLITGASRNSYIDLFLDRCVNATELATGINRALKGDYAYRWFIE